LAIGLVSTLKHAAPQYVGMDISMTAVRWCRRYIAKAHASCTFLHLPLHNERYNPTGVALDDTFHFPWPDASFDVIYLYSVFSHMRSSEIRIYLREFRRLLCPSGHVFFTAFTEMDVPEEMENPADYQDDWKGPLHCVRFEKGFFVRMIEEAGFKIDRYDHGTETDAQSGYYLSVKD
jgi:SAM-dependent methyltransferase